MHPQLDEFTRAYITTALWSSTDDEGTPLDTNYCENDLTAESLARMAEDCRKFQAENSQWFTREHCLNYGPDFGIEGRAGHDFWLTRNGHGAGFWDGNWSDHAGEALTAAAHQYGECYLVVDNKGSIHIL